MAATLSSSGQWWLHRLAACTLHPRTPPAPSPCRTGPGLRCCRQVVWRACHTLPHPLGHRWGVHLGCAACTCKRRSLLPLPLPSDSTSALGMGHAQLSAHQVLQACPPLGHAVVGKLAGGRGPHSARCLLTRVHLTDGAALASVGHASSGGHGGMSDAALSCRGCRQIGMWFWAAGAGGLSTYLAHIQRSLRSLALRLCF
jgi:hypothetical protein